MKRYISLACIALVIVTCMVSPVSAADLQSNFIDLLDYNLPNSGMSRTVYFSPSNSLVNFPMPVVTSVFYIDILVDISGYVPSVFVLNDGITSYQLSPVHISNDLYRIFGKLNGNSTANLSFSASVLSTSTLDFHSIKISPVSLDLMTVPVEGTGFYPGGSFDMSKNWGDSRPVSTLISYDDNNFNHRDFTLFLSPRDWQRFDYIEYQVGMIVSDITAVSAVFGQDNIPFDISYIQNGTGENTFYLNITLDCRSLDRTIDDFPMVIIQGNVIFDGVSSISLMNSNGIVIIDDVSPFVVFFNRVEYWFTYNFSTYFNYLDSWIKGQTSSLISAFNNLDTWIKVQTSSLITAFNNLDSWLSYYFGTYFNYLQVWLNTHASNIEAAIRGDTSPGNSFQQQVNQADQQLNDMAAVMDSVNQPDLNTVNVSANTYVDSTVLAASMSGITSVFSQGLYFDIIVMSIMMATAGYVLFGKR